MTLSFPAPLEDLQLPYQARWTPRLPTAGWQVACWQLSLAGWRRVSCSDLGSPLCWVALLLQSRKWSDRWVPDFISLRKVCLILFWTSFQKIDLWLYDFKWKCKMFLEFFYSGMKIKKEASKFVSDMLQSWRGEWDLGWRAEMAGFPWQWRQTL